MATDCRKVLQHFQTTGTPVSAVPHGNGHINDTYLVTLADGKRLILQKMNRHVFQNPKELMENVQAVTEFLKQKITEAGGDASREALSLVPAENGQGYYCDEAGEYWRMFHYIEDTFCYDMADTPELFAASGFAFGNFQRMLADYPAETLHETIPGFHDTGARFARFRQVLALDPLGRAKSAKREIDFVLAHEELAQAFAKISDVPIRVTHNDTKLNNILMDAKTGKGICVIDLDTVMPGLVMNDFGDSIRFGASTGAEDETDLSKVSCSMEYFRAYTESFLAGCGGRLTQQEISLLPLGAKVITYECGMRFLTDYLEGDVYFKIHRENHNLDRCRTQFQLVADMEQKWDRMRAIVAAAEKRRS